MRLTSLSVDRLPGVDEPLQVARLDPGVNVIIGPNASGKSSLVRALLALLYPREHEGVIGVEARFETAAGATLQARRLGQDVAWERAGQRSEAPTLPAYHLIGTYTIGLEDLVGTGDHSAQSRQGSGRSRASGSTDAGGGSEVDGLIADSIVRQLTGGIDIAAVRRSIGGQSQAGRKLSTTLRSANQERKRLERSREELHEREARLPVQRAELEAARAHARRGRVVEDAAALLDAHTDLAGVEAELASYPPDMDLLRGDEGDALTTLHAAARAEAETLEALEGRSEDVWRSLGSSGAGRELSAAAVDSELRRAEQLVSDAARLDQKTVERRALLAQYREIGSRLGAEPDRLAGLGDIAVSDKTIERVEALLERRQTLRAEEHTLRRQLSRLPEPAPDHEPAPVDQLVRLRTDLLTWSSAPPVEPRRPEWTWLVALLLTVAVVGAGSFDLADMGVWLLAAATGCWLLVAGLVVRPMTSAVRRQVEAETNRATAQYGVAGPTAWSHAEVADRVVAIDRLLAEQTRRAADERARIDAVSSLGADLAMTRAMADDVHEELEGLKTTTGFAVAPDALLAAWLHAARDLGHVRTTLAGVEVEGAHLAERVEAARTELQAFLKAAHDGSPDAARPDELRAAVKAMARAVERRDADLVTLTSLTNDRERSGAALARLTDERRGVLAAAGVGDGPDAEDELRRRLTLLPAWRAASQRRRDHDARRATLEPRLSGHDDLLVLVAAGDSLALEEAAAASRAAQERAERLGNEIGLTVNDIEKAGSDRSIDLATVRLEQARDELSAHRAEAVRLEAARFLLDSVEAEHRSEARPPALDRAAALFERFTRGAFVLRFAGGVGTRRQLAAADASGRPLELNELSTGTRAQLLIASRLAFALEAEDAAGHTLPFFLDEALTTSDPERFAAVAGALLDVAAGEGRQFIYLSARSDDAELWQRAADAHGSAIRIVQLGSHGTGSAASPAAN